jgi:hypothetical protein
MIKMQISVAQQLQKIPATTENIHKNHKFKLLCKKRIPKKLGTYTINKNWEMNRIMMLPQNALLLISFGQNIFHTISTSHKLSPLDSFITAINKISRKRWKPNARTKGMNLMGRFKRNGWKASTYFQILAVFARPNQLIESTFACR